MKNVAARWVLIAPAASCEGTISRNTNAHIVVSCEFIDLNLGEHQYISVTDPLAYCSVKEVLGSDMNEISASSQCRDRGGVPRTSFQRFIARGQSHDRECDERNYRSELKRLRTTRAQGPDFGVHRDHAEEKPVNKRDVNVRAEPMLLLLALAAAGCHALVSGLKPSLDRHGASVLS